MRVFDTMTDDPNIREYYIDPMIAWWNKHPDVTPDQMLPLPKPVLRQRALAKYGKQVGDVLFEEMVELCTWYRNDPEVPDPTDPNVARFAMRDGKVVVEYIGFGNDSDDTNAANSQYVTDTQAGSVASLFGSAPAASAVPSGSTVSTGSLPPAPSSIQPIAPSMSPAHMYPATAGNTGTSAFAPSAPSVSSVPTDTSSLPVFTPYAAPDVQPAPPLAARGTTFTHDSDTDKLAFNPDGTPRLTPYMQPDKWPELCKFTRPVKHMTRKLEGREDLIRSMLAAFERPELCNVILLAGAGTGKALVNGTPIAVDDARGFVPIEQLAVGDKVFALDGKPTRVTGVFPQGVKQVWRVEFADGTHIDCNSSHVWPVIVGRKQIRKARGFEPDEPRSFIDKYVDDDKHTMTTKELYERMEGIRHGQGSNMPNLYVPANGPVSRTQPAWPEHGAFDGDGAHTDAMLKQLMSQGYGAGVSFGMALGAHGNDAPDACGFTLHTTHPEAIEQLARLHDVKPSVETSRQVFNSTPMYVATFDHMDRADMTGPFLNDDGFLHDWVLAARRDIMLAVVRGVFDARGYVTAKRKHIVAVSLPHARLAEQLLSLLSSLGVRGFMTTRRNPKRTAEHVVQVLADHERLQQLFASRSAAVDQFEGVPCSYSRRGVESFGTRITAVYPLHKKAHQTCIMVEDEQHCFLAGYTNMPTHNTALVQGTMAQDPGRLYLEVDLARMLADIEPDKMAARIKMLFDEVERFVKDSHVEIVLFIDEFHQIVELSAAAVEALKPLLAASGTRGVRVVAATTYIEFREFIAPNQPLVERLQRINVPEPDEELTVKIVKGFAKTYGVERDIAEHIYHEIYELTNRYIPANNQPRKSILMLDAMTGWHRLTKQPMNHDLLAQCLMSQEGVNVDMNVDAAGIKAQLDKRVFDQTIATTAIESNLQTAVAGMNDPTKPMATLLFSGSSGVGKTEVAKQLSQILFGDGHNMIRFDMSEYANADSLNRFRTLLTAEVWAHPYCVLLLDEIEKADATITRLLLSVLDDGRLTDENDRVVNFTNCYVIMTTNAGSEIFQTMGQFDTNDRNNDRLAQQQWLDDHFSQIRESLQSATSKFPPELLGRVGRGIIPFRPLTRITKYRILHMYMDSIAERFRVHHGVEVVWQGEGQAVPPAANRVEQFIIEDQLDSGNANAGGGREVKLTFDSLVLSRMSACVNQNKYAKKIEVRVVGTMRNEDKSSRLSKSLIEVVAVE